MTNLFDGLDRAENNPFIYPFNYGAFDLSSKGMTDGLVGNWTPTATSFAVESPSPDQAPPAHPAYADRSSDPSDVIALRSEVDMLKGELRATQARLRHFIYDSDLRMSSSEQKYQYDQIKTSRIRHAQEQQLERRLQHHIKKSIVEAMQQAMDRFIRVRRSVGLDPTTQDSTYSVPQRPEGTGIFS